MKTNMFTRACLIAAAIFTISSCGGGPKTKTNDDNNTQKMKKYQKKYTNADFYKDGKLQKDVCVAAYKDMFDFYGVPWSDELDKLIWITDFELGDMENVGMAGVIWVNDPEFGYFGHDIYLLPGQMVAEHRHVPTDFPAKHEAWKVNHGWCYNFSTGEATANPPVLPASQKGFISVKHFVKQNVDEVVSLNKLEEPHFLLAGENGAIVHEYATYHDGDGLRFTNPKVVFTDVLTAE